MKLDWDVITGLLPAVLIIAMLLRQILQKITKGQKRRRDSHPTDDRFKRDYDPIEPR